MPQLTQGFGFDLPHPLPGHVELPAQLFQRPGTPVLQPEAHWIWDIMRDLLMKT